MISVAERANPPEIPGAQYVKALGAGGFSDVFLYRQGSSGRDIAVKVLRKDVTAEQNNAFEEEVSLMGQISAHPSLLSVRSAGVSADGRSYLMMDYCPPPNLGQRARQERFTVARVLEIGIHIAGAVESLHRANIIHRDIKPANILLTQSEQPVLTDFGTAISTTSGCVHNNRGYSVPWASPEQQMGTGICAPSLDVYALAATLYTALAGRSPFEVFDGDNREIAMLNRILRLPVPPIERDDVPEELERVLAIAMAKAPSDRYQSAYEFARALQEIQWIMNYSTTDIDVFERPAA